MCRKYYIGTNFGHSSSSCLLDDEGNILFAVEEDRLLKEKYTEKFPSGGIELIRNQIKPGAKIIWSEGWNMYRRFLIKGLWHSIKFYDDSIYFQKRFLKEWRRLKNGISQYRSLGNFNFVGHHLSHAFSLIPFGLKDKSLILVSDTMGEAESVSVYHWGNGRMKFIHSIKYPNSPGSVFHQFAYHVGFKGRTGPGKLMALSGLGTPKWFHEFEKIAKVSDGRFCINNKIYPAHRLKDAPEKYCDSLGSNCFKTELNLCENSYLAAKDIAASIQEWFTSTTWKLIWQNIEYSRNKLGLEINHLGLVGGAALNCQANGYILRKMKGLNLGELTVSPWSEDSGTAIGAAVSTFLKANPNRIINKASAFLGPDLFPSEILNEPSEILQAVECILSGGFIALVDGRLEFGPRALGGRCIIASPFIDNNQIALNACKGRSEFMPFAPAVLEEDFDKLFENTGSENMAWTVKAKPHASEIIPAAIHKNGEVRVQLVKKNSGLLYALLKCVQQSNSIGIVLLTSLNGAGETIPVYYDDAVKMAQKLKLHGIISRKGFENFFIN